jgi:hypothetical protein
MDIFELNLRACSYKNLPKVSLPSNQILYSQRASKNPVAASIDLFLPLRSLSRSTMGSSTHQRDQTKGFRFASGFDGSVGKSQGTSNGLPPKEGKFSTRELQERFQGKSEDIVPLPF